MSVVVPPDLEEEMGKLVRSGKYQNESEVLREALALLGRRDQLRCAIDAGIQQLENGQFREYDESALDRFKRDLTARMRTIATNQN